MKNSGYVASAFKYIMVIVVTALVTLYVSTFWVGDDNDYLRYLIKTYYVDDVSNDDLYQGAKMGMLEKLGDSHTFYIYPEYGYDFFEEKITGEFCGIGITIEYKHKDDDYVTISDVNSDLSAGKCGVKSGDVLIRVDDKDVKDMETDEIAVLVRGKEGSKVNITVMRDQEELTFSLTREEISNESVKGKILDGNIGYVYISQFDSDTDEELKRKVADMGNVKGLIIDLRDNPGGIMNTAVSALDLFLDKGDVIVTAKYKKSETVYKSKHEKTFSMPLVVIANENSASASELFCAAIKENGRGKVVGTTTYGKGSIQRTFKLAHNSGANITVGRFYSPKGHKIDKSGIKPNIFSELPEDIKDKYITELSPDEDIQLKDALSQF